MTLEAFHVREEDATRVDEGALRTTSRHHAEQDGP